MSAPQIKIFGEVKKGKFIADDPTAFKNAFLQHEDKRVYVVVGKETKHRSNKQLAYYWGVVIKVLANELGYHEDEMHDVLRFKFLTGVKEILGKSFMYVKSTSELTTVEFEEYLQHVRDFAGAELNVIIPLPNEVLI